ncbi:MAG: hypothetical protein NUV47_03660 [Patescibacteria group bacterium]|nr:hypothetical protein [Patescibacteria group bacterium]
MKPAIHQKPFSKMGKWIEKKTIAEILVCVCGNKYIKTRKNQTVCVRCIAKLQEVVR